MLSKFSNDGHTLLYGTFFADETNGYNFSPTSLAVGANGITFIGGYSNASAIPTTSGAVKGACTTPSNTYTCTTVDGFVASFDTTKTGSSSLVYSTRIGGSATSQGSNIPNQEVLGVAADSNNDAYVTGYTYDQTFPVPTTGYMNACNTANPNNVNNCDTAFVLELNPAGTSILGGSFLSGPAAYYESSVGYKVALDSSDRVYLYGTSADGYNTFPLVNPVQGYSNNNELYIATMSSDLTKLLFSTRFGNPSLNGGNVTPVNGLALDPSNNIYFAATTNDTNFAATAGTYATAVNSGTGAHTFFAKLTAVLAPTSTTLTVSPSTVNTGQNVTFNVTVAGTTQSSPTPTGTVTLTNTSVAPATTLATVTLNGGTGSYTTSGLAAGTYQVTATYSADDVYDVSTSSTVTLTVNNAPALLTPSITLSVPSTAASGASVTFTANVSGSGATPTGTINFYDGTTALGSGSLSSGAASYSTSSLAVGAHSITAQYGGDSNYSAGTSSAQTITVTAPTAGFTVAANPTSATVTPGGSTTAVITITPSNGFNSATTLSCSGLPAYSTCSFSPASVTPSSGPVTSTVTIATNVASATAALRPANTDRETLAHLTLAGSSGVLVACLFWPGLLRRKNRAAWLRMMAIAVFAVIAMQSLTGCGGGKNNSSSTGSVTPAGQSTVTITATAGSLTHTTTLSLTVN